MSKKITPDPPHFHFLNYSKRSSWIHKTSLAAMILAVISSWPMDYGKGRGRKERLLASVCSGTPLPAVAGPEQQPGARAVARGSSTSNRRDLPERASSSNTLGLSCQHLLTKMEGWKSQSQPVLVSPSAPTLPASQLGTKCTVCWTASPSDMGMRLGWMQGLAHSTRWHSPVADAWDGQDLARRHRCLSQAVHGVTEVYEAVPLFLLEHAARQHTKSGESYGSSIPPKWWASKMPVRPEFIPAAHPCQHCPSAGAKLSLQSMSSMAGQNCSAAALGTVYCIKRSNRQRTSLLIWCQRCTYHLTRLMKGNSLHCDSYV